MQPGGLASVAVAALLMTKRKGLCFLALLATQNMCVRATTALTAAAWRDLRCGAGRSSVCCCNVRIPCSVGCSEFFRLCFFLVSLVGLQVFGFGGGRTRRIRYCTLCVLICTIFHISFFFTSDRGINRCFAFACRQQRHDTPLKIVVTL